MNPTIISCSFTGHRPKSFSFGYSEETDEFKELMLKIKNTIIQIANAGCRTFYCGMAEGVDLWCGQIVLDIRDQFDPPLAVIPVVPFLAQPSSMTEKNKVRYRRIMEASSERYLVSKQYTKACFQKRNRFLVESADALLAVFNPTETRSGTAQTLRYAKRLKRKIFLISP